MKIKALFEDSGLSSIGVSNRDVGNIHSTLGLKHDSSYKSATKSQAVQAVKARGAIIAVDENGDAYGVAFWEHPMSGGQRVRVATPKGNKAREFSSLSDAFKAINGRQFKFFVADGKHNTKSHVRQRYDYGEKFLKKAMVFNKLIQQEAQTGYETIKSHLMDVVDSDEDTRGLIIHGTRGSYTPQHKDMAKIKSAMLALKKTAQSGFNSWAITDHYYGRKGSTKLMQEFFGTTYEYMLDSASEDFEENHKLAIHKFVKFAIRDIRNVVERSTTGQYENNGVKADDYGDGDK
jgi:hypothetical protein